MAAQQDGTVCGFSVLHLVHRPETPYRFAGDYLEIVEFGVDEACRRQGTATAMIAFIRDYAAQKGLHRIELNMWESNRDALAFYEAVDFSTFRRYMELFI